MTLNTSNGSIYTHIANQIATISFGHPASNSFPSELLARLTNELNLLSNNPEVVVIVLKSDGDGAFCAGASFDELLAVSNRAESTAFFSGFAHLINAMRSCSKIIIGRIHGKAVGGGVGIAAACDYTFATDEASIKLSEIAIGFGPFVIEPAVSRKIGKTAFSELALAPHEWKNAYWAKEKGLYAHVFESNNKMDKEIDFFSSKLASYNPAALKALKEVLWEGTEYWETYLLDRAKISGKLVLSEFTITALNKSKKQ
jgi:methylglutaconyl-CoA hydratase